MTPRTMLSLAKKIRFEDQEAHVIDFYIQRGSSNPGFIDEAEDKRYVQNCLEDGTALDQAIAQLEVLRDEHMERMLQTSISREDMIQSEIDAITGGNEQEWRMEARPSISEIMHVEQLKRMQQV